MKKRILFGCGLLVFLGIVLWMSQLKSEEAVLLEMGQIKREDYGKESKIVSIWVEGLESDLVPLEVVVGSRVYTQEEANQVFEQVMGQLPQLIVGENTSLLAIETDLILPKIEESYGILLSWSIEDNPWISNKGEIIERPLESVMLDLEVTLSHDCYQSTYLIPICIEEKTKTQEEQVLEDFISKIEEEESNQKNAEFLWLPQTFEGKNISYQLEGDSDYGTLMVLGFLVIGLWIANQKQKETQRRKEREQELMLDYAEIISKLLVYIGAGMTVGTAWERLVKDYELGLKKQNQKRRAAYDEMSQTYYEIKRGVSESKAFREFGKRCRLQPYLRLSTLLEQNRKTGVKNLRGLLQIESIDAWEQRKNLAIRLGEEATTKLLIPLFMMLIVVMVMIMVPAMMTMY